MILKKYATSICVSSSKSVVCIAFKIFVVPNFALIVFGRNCLPNS